MMRGKRQKHEEGDRGRIRDATIAPAERAAALSRIGADAVHLYEPDIAAALDDESGLVRGAALKVLVGQWFRGAYLDRARSLLAADPSWVTRSDAAYALARYARAHEEVQGVVARALLAQIQDSDDESVQRACLRELGHLLGSAEGLSVDGLRELGERAWDEIARRLPTAESADAPPTSA